MLSWEEWHRAYGIEAGVSEEESGALYALFRSVRSGAYELLAEYQDVIYEEVPVSIEEFVYGKEYLNLDGVIYPAIFQLLRLCDDPSVREMDVSAGKGGGKSFLVSCAMARMVYMLLCLKNPQQFYMLAPGSLIAVVNVSVSESQARNVVFREFKNRIMGTRWFADMLQEPPGMSMARFKKGVCAMSGSSSWTGMLGYNVIFGAMDEVSYMEDAAGKDAAEELTRMLKGSMETRFPGDYKLMRISSPKSVTDHLYRSVLEIRNTGSEIALGAWS
jgi:hypothetical protein